jgi:CRISPR-associated protein Csb3
MTHREPSFSVNVDVGNPGHFFACCGLLELAHRLWPGAEGWFDVSKPKFAILSVDPSATLQGLKTELSQCEITGLYEAEHQERESLELKDRELRKQGKRLPDDEESRRKELGTLAREGRIRLGRPFNMTLDWWQTADEDTTSPKTWAGRQEIHKIARAAQNALTNILKPEDLMNHSCVMRTPREYQKNKVDQNKPVEPFYFDARRYAHSLDTGFSLDAQDAETIACPAVELLSLIGLQRFRPAPSSNKWGFEYLAWSRPLSPAVASVGFYCAVLPGARYSFQLRFRDDQKRYKAFGFSTHMGGPI